MEAKALEDGLLAVNGKVVRVLGDDKFGTQAEGGQAALERAGGSGGDQRRLVAIIFKTKFGANGDQFDEPPGLVVELFGTLLTDEFKLVLVGFVVVGVDGLFDDFELIQAFETAVVLTFGCLFLWLAWLLVPLRW